MMALVYIELSVSVVLLSLGGLVLFLAPHRKINQTFFLATCIGAVAVILEYLTRVAGSEHAAVILGRLYVAAYCLEYWAFLQFALEYRWASRGELVEKHRRGVIRVFTLLPLAVWAFMIVGTSFFMSRVIMKSWGYFIEVNSGLPVYFQMIISLCYYIAIVRLFWLEAYRNEDRERARTGKLLFWVLAIAVLLGITIDNVIGRFVSIPEVATLFFLSILCAFAYACAKERFLAITPVSVADEILENLGDGILLISSEGRITYCNYYFREVLGFSEEELLGAPFVDIGAKPKEVPGLLDYIKREGKVSCYGELFDLEIGVLNKEKEEVPFGLSGTYLGKGRGWSLTLRDLREKQRTERILEEKNRELERKTITLREFFHIASHELRSPLTVMRIALEMLGSATPEEKRREAEDIIRDNVIVLDELIEDLLNASRIEQGSFPITRENIDPGAALASALHDMKTKYPGGEFSLHREEQISAIYADSNRLRQLLFILLDNAVNYAEGEIGIVTVQNGDMFRVSVLDRGPGVPEEEANKIFDQFYRSKGAKKKAGSNVGLGLGLFIAKKIVEGHGGELGYRGREGGGAEFFFSLPVEKDGHDRPNGQGVPS